MTLRWRITPLAAAFAAVLAALMRWMQKVHFSITPRERTVSPGRRCRAPTW